MQQACPQLWLFALDEAVELLYYVLVFVHAKRLRCMKMMPKVSKLMEVWKNFLWGKTVRGQRANAH